MHGDGVYDRVPLARSSCREEGACDATIQAFAFYHRSKRRGERCTCVLVNYGFSRWIAVFSAWSKIFPLPPNPPGRVSTGFGPSWRAGWSGRNCILPWECHSRGQDMAVVEKKVKSPEISAVSRVADTFLSERCGRGWGCLQVVFPKALVVPVARQEKDGICPPREAASSLPREGWENHTQCLWFAYWAWMRNSPRYKVE